MRENRRVPWGLPPHRRRISAQRFEPVSLGLRLQLQDQEGHMRQADYQASVDPAGNATFGPGLVFEGKLSFKGQVEFNGTHRAFLSRHLPQPACRPRSWGTRATAREPGPALSRVSRSPSCRVSGPRPIRVMAA